MDTNNLKRHLTDFSSIYITQAVFNGCFYGIRAVFVLYAINRFSLNEAQAISVFATFMVLCYGTSLIGGYIADNGLGVKNTVMTGGIFSALGALFILSSSQDLCFFGLALFSLGSGFFKPNIPAAAGLLFEDPKDPRKDKVYSVLYITMNFGSLIIPLICSFVGKTWGWHYGIMLIALGFTGATFFVYKTMYFYPSYTDKMTASKIKVFWNILSLIAIIYLLFTYQNYFHSLMSVIMCGSIIYMGSIFYQCQGQERKDILTIVLYILLFTLFCTLYEQSATSLMLFCEKTVDREVMGTVIPSSALLSLDPLFVLVCGPILLTLSGKYFKKVKPVSGFVKIGCGFLCVAASFGIFALSVWKNNDAPVSLSWIIGAMLIQTLGELWIAPISFAKISQYAPPRFKSVLMSFWSMAIAYGHYLAGLVAQFSLKDATSLPIDNPFEQYHIFFTCLALLALCIGLALLLVQGVKFLYYIVKNRQGHSLELL